jgi:hypothetical protein
VGWRSPSFVVLALAASLALAGPAAAAGATAPGSAPPVFLDVRLEGAALSFSAAELAAAVGLRLTLAPAAAVGATPVVVTSPSPGQVAIASGWRRRAIDVAGAPAAEAARLVALMIVDLVRPEVALPAPASIPGPPPAVPAPAAADTPPPAAASAVVAARRAPLPSPAAPRLPPRLTLAAAMGIATGTTDAGASASPTVEARLALGSRARLVLAAAFDRAEALVRDGQMQSTLAVTTLPVRLGVGARLGFVELRAGGLVRTYLASGLASRGGAVGGMFAAVAVELPLGSALVPFGVLGVDVHPQAVAFQFAGQTVLELGRFAPWLAVGLAWRGRTA